MALENNRSLLKDYSFIAVSPEGLDMSPVTDRVDFESVKRFDPVFFQSPQSYNKLLINPEFWSAFTDFDYMLIVQLDVIIFRNELDIWLDKGFDYIGAPWLNGFGSNNQLSPKNIGVLFKTSEPETLALHRFFREHGVIDQNDLFQLDYWKANIELLSSPVKTITSVELAAFLDDIEYYFHRFVGVGNGGFSLRNIAKSLGIFSTKSVPYKFVLSTPEMGRFPMMHRDLKMLKDICIRIHELNTKVVASLKGCRVESEYETTVIELIGNYTPERSDIVFSVTDAVAKLLGDHPELQMISTMLSQMSHNAVTFFLQNMTIPEDFFWGEVAPLFNPEYSVAPVDEALKFSFECNPRYCYERNGRKLPFGAHAWQLSENLEFWDDYLPINLGTLP